jgi:hypothetical protein
MHVIDLNEWNVNDTDLLRWVLEKEVELYAVAKYGPNRTQIQYAFTDEEDYLAFTLTFQKDKT